VIRPLVALVATVLVATALGHAFVAATVADQGWIEGRPGRRRRAFELARRIAGRSSGR
jgi:hypothetical protein